MNHTWESLLKILLKNTILTNIHTPVRRDLMIEIRFKKKRHRESERGRK